MTDLLSPEFDWRSAQIRFPSPQEEGETQQWSLVVCGDWSPGAGQQQAILENPAGFYGELLPVMQESDLAMVNLEGVLTDAELQPIVKDGITIQLPASAVIALSTVPFHLACLANNHTFDYGAEGLIKTQGFLERHHIGSIGAGLCAEEAEMTRILQFGNTRLAIVNIAEGEEARPVNGGPGVSSLDLSRLRTQLSSLRAQADFILVVVHAGREYLPVPAPYIRSIYRSLVDAGADMVVGHHPHVPQGIELYNDAPIVYSLGNFAFWEEAPLKYQHLGYVLRARFRGPKLNRLEIWPYRINLNGLELLTGERAADFLLELSELSTIITDDDCLSDVWDAYADRWLVAQGMCELSDSVALLGAGQLLARSMLKASLYRFEGDHGTHRLARRGIWYAIHWLDRRIRSAQSLMTSSRLRMKRGAAILSNRFDTLAHRELYVTALRRVRDGKLGHAPGWAYRLLDNWEVFGSSADFEGDNSWSKLS